MCKSFRQSGFLFALSQQITGAVFIGPLCIVTFPIISILIVRFIGTVLLSFLLLKQQLAVAVVLVVVRLCDSVPISACSCCLNVIM